MREGREGESNSGKKYETMEKVERIEPSFDGKESRVLEIAEVMPIFTNGIFGEMQIRYLFARWTSLEMYENELQMRN